MSKKHIGFSLIELLVVLAILAILSGIIIPIWQKSITSAQSMSCKNNLRQLGQAFLLYAYDSGGKFPHSDRDSDIGTNYCWFDVLDPYLSQNNLVGVKQCPSWEGYTTTDTKDEHSFKMNAGLCPKEHPQETMQDISQRVWYWPRWNSIQHKRSTVLLLDGRMDEPYNTYTETRTRYPYQDIANRHDDGANILFVEGNVRYVKPAGETIEEVGWKTPNTLLWKP